MDWAVLDFVGFDWNELTCIGLAWAGADEKGLTWIGLALLEVGWNDVLWWIAVRLERLTCKIRNIGAKHMAISSATLSNSDAQSSEKQSSCMQLWIKIEHGYVMAISACMNANKYGTGSECIGLDWNWIGKGWIGLDWLEVAWIGMYIGLAWHVMDCIGMNRIAWDWTVFDRLGLDSNGLDWIGSHWIWMDWFWTL